MHENRKLTVNITNRTIIRTIFWAVLAVLAYKFVGRVTHVLTLIFGSAFLALALNPVVRWMSKYLKLKSRVRATAAAYLTVVLVISAFLVLVIPPLVSQTRDFIKDVPRTVANFQQQDSSLARAAKKYNLDDKLTKAARDFTSNYENFGTTILDTGKRVAQAIASVLVVVVMTFMMLVEGPKWINLYLSTVPDKKRERYKKIGYRIYRAVTSFVNGQVILAAVAAAFAFVTLQVASRVLEVEINSLALAGIVAVFGIIPLFGNPLAASIVILVSLLSSVTLGVVMSIYFIIYYLN